MTKVSSQETAAPAKSPNAWLWTLVRGVLALILGIYLMVGAQTAPTVVAYVLAIYVTLAGAMQTFRGLFNRDAPGSTTDRVRGLVGLIGGLGLLLLLFFNVLSLSAAYTFLAILLIVFGALGLFEAFFDRGASRFRWMAVLINVLLLALGVLVFYSRMREFDLRLWSGVLLAVIGVVVIGYAYLIQKPRPNTPATSV
jgi:uncharacterized membrane protein HdeD (DUF308 family)